MLNRLVTVIVAKLLLVAFVFTAQLPAADQGDAPAGPPPTEGRLYNLDSKPFAFRLARKSGKSWTDEITVAPGQHFSIRTGAAGNTEALEGITGDGTGHVLVEYRELGGRIRLMLPAVDRGQNIYVASWYHVRDSNGFSRLVQAADQAAAEKRHQELLAEPPYTEKELTRLKQMLRANYVLFDK